MIEELLIRFGRLAIGFLAILGPLILLIFSIKLRDKRESMLYDMILKELNTADLRGLFSVRARPRLLSWYDIVIVNMWGCSNRQMWDVAMRMSFKLPPRVWLVMDGLLDQRSKLTVRLKVKRDFPYTFSRPNPGRDDQGS